MSLDNLKKAPFNLDAVALNWVQDTFASLTPAERISQLFVLLVGVGPDDFKSVSDFGPGGITAMFKGNADKVRQDVLTLVKNAKVPPLVSADLEGSRMSLPFGAEVPNPLALAAINDVAATREISRIMAEEAIVAGINWSFTPVLDVNHAFRSAIVATRGFGSDVETIQNHALAQIEVFQAHGLAATAKHWPGEGYDDRDQHLVTTINPLSMPEWERVFGKLYRAAIDAGVLSIMSAHIALPAFIHESDPDAGLEAYRPASVSRKLTHELLREKLGFNGVIVSDATPMAGLGSWSPRRTFVPELLNAGCDVILFSPDPAADVEFINRALSDGTLLQSRIDDAVIRILGLKAKLGLHLTVKIMAIPNLNTSKVIASAITDRAPTLVKDTQNLLPLTREKHSRILLITTGISEPWAPVPIPFIIPDLLTARGFAITMHHSDTIVSPEHFDLVLYLFGDETLLTRNRIYLDWLKLNNNFIKAMDRYWHDIPTLMISCGFPYMLYDAPRVPTYINAYSTMDTMQDAVVKALLGEIPWNKNSPIDPFCGLGDARY